MHPDLTAPAFAGQTLVTEKSQRWHWLLHLLCLAAFSAITYFNVTRPRADLLVDPLPPELDRLGAYAAAVCAAEGGPMDFHWRDGGMFAFKCRSGHAELRQKSTPAVPSVVGEMTEEERQKGMKR